LVTSGREVTSPVLSPSQRVGSSLAEVVMVGKAWAQASTQIESDESSLDFSDASCLNGALSLWDWFNSTLTSFAVLDSGNSCSGSGSEDE
jgi:hypothetical protein